MFRIVQLGLSSLTLDEICEFLQQMLHIASILKKVSDILDRFPRSVFKEI